MKIKDANTIFVRVVVIKRVKMKLVRIKLHRNEIPHILSKKLLVVDRNYKNNRFLSI